MANHTYVEVEFENDETTRLADLEGIKHDLEDATRSAAPRERPRFRGRLSTEESRSFLVPS